MVINFTFSDGDAVRDVVTKVCGSVIGAWHSTTSVNRYLVAYRNDAGTMCEDWLDEERLEILECNQTQSEL